jgi:hypothetical protein
MFLVSLWLLVICWSHCVLTQPLESEQHFALMNVYDALGSSLVDSECITDKVLFLF